MHLSVRLLAVVVVLGLSSAAFAELVDNPAYQNWAKYKPGTTVTIKQTVEFVSPPDNLTAAQVTLLSSMEMTYTEKLVEVKPDSLILEVATKISIPNQTSASVSTVTRTVRAKVEKGQEYIPLIATSDVFPDVKDMKEGKDKVEVKGVSFDAVTREFTVRSWIPSATQAAATATAKGSTVTMKTWTVAQIPGGDVKVERTALLNGAAAKSTIVLVDYTIAN